MYRNVEISLIYQIRWDTANGPLKSDRIIMDCRIKQFLNKLRNWTDLASEQRINELARAKARYYTVNGILNILGGVNEKEICIFTAAAGISFVNFLVGSSD